MTSINSTKGFSLIEITFVIILVGVLATFTISNVGRNDDSMRAELTRSKLEALRTAVLGSEASVDNEGKRMNFGYFGDIGTMPTHLGDLVTRPTGMNTWAFSSTYGFALGWHGPYIQSTNVTGDKGFDRDGWGRAFALTTGASPTITSLGSDNSVGGTLLASDLIMSFPASSRLSSVTGLVEDFNARAAGMTVEIAYPVAGAINTFSVVSDANGFFRFQTVPFGVRSLRVKRATPQVPRQVVIDKNNFMVPTSLLNLFGLTETVSYVAASLFKTAAGFNVFISLASTYTSQIQLDAMTPSWTGGVVNLTGVKLNGVSETFTASASGNPVNLSADLVIPPNSSQNSLELNFSGAPTGNLSITFTWLHRTRTDSIGPIAL